MKKLLYAIIGGLLIANLSALPYTAEIVNNSGEKMSLEYSGGTREIPNGESKVELDTYLFIT